MDTRHVLYVFGRTLRFFGCIITAEVAFWQLRVFIDCVVI